MKKNIILTLTILTIFSMFINVYAKEKLQEVKVAVDNTGLRVIENDNNIYRDNIFTSNSDVLVQGMDMYTSDSKDKNELHGCKPGDKLKIDTGFILKNKDNTPVETIELTVQPFINKNKSDIANSIYQEYNDKIYKDMINGAENVISSVYGEYLPEKYKIIVHCYPDGTQVLETSKNMPNNYLMAVTEMVDPMTGEKIEITKINRMFIALGDGSNSDPNLNPDINNPDKTGPIEPPNSIDEGFRWITINASSIPFGDMSPEISSAITSDIYNVENSIPTSENLKWRITADKAIYDIQVRNTTIEGGGKGIKVVAQANYDYMSHDYIRTDKIKYTEKGKTKYRYHDVYEWRVHHDGGPVKVEKEFDYSNSLNVFDVPKSNIFPVSSGSLSAKHAAGDTLNSGTIALEGTASPGPQKLFFRLKVPPISKNNGVYAGGGYANKNEARNAAERAANNKIEEIKAIINAAIERVCAGQFVNYNYEGLNVNIGGYSGTPNVGKTNGSNVNMIPSTYANGFYDSDGTVIYGGASFGTKPNNVVVHTPVINLSDITWRSQFVNQKINKDIPEKYYLMLDEDFTITIPDSGKHKNAQGYGKRKYNSNQAVPRQDTNWGKIKDVRFPFDIYVKYGNNLKHFLKANTWLSESNPPQELSTTVTSYTFTIPVWAKEGKHEIETRVVAENAKDYTLGQEGANLDIEKYVATKNIPVEVIGKIYDLRINASNDPGWREVYSQKTHKDYIEPNEFPFGQPGQNRIPQYKYAPKLGYSFVFNFKTKGRKSNNIDVNIQPEGFYFVSKEGGRAKPVDLYYDSVKGKNIPILPSDNIGNISVRLTEPYMEVPTQEFVDSNRIYPNPKEIGKIYNYNLNVNIGNFAKMNLPHSLRLCYNNFAEYIKKLYGRNSTEVSISANAGTRDWVIGSVGHWHAGYRLPATTKVVEKGKNINDAVRENSFLKDGYIIVKMDLKTKYKNEGNNYDYLRYLGPEAKNDRGEEIGKLIPEKDWTKDNDTDNIILPNGKPAEVPNGSVAIFEANLRSSNDLEVGTTH